MLFSILCTHSLELSFKCWQWIFKQCVLIYCISQVVHVAWGCWSLSVPYTGLTQVHIFLFVYNKKPLQMLMNTVISRTSFVQSQSRRTRLCIQTPWLTVIRGTSPLQHWQPSLADQERKSRRHWIVIKLCNLITICWQCAQYLSFQNSWLRIPWFSEYYLRIKLTWKVKYTVCLCPFTAAWCECSSYSPEVDQLMSRHFLFLLTRN